MLQRFRKNSGQMILSQMLLATTFVLAAIIGISVYVRRAYQARIADVDSTMLRYVANAMNANITTEYEPYYVETHTRSDQAQNSTVQVVGGGVLSQTTLESTTQHTISTQQPPFKASSW